MTHRQPKLAAFDLDGTLLRGDTVCEALARPLGRLDRMKELEQIQVSDLDGIKASAEEMAGWYEDSTRTELYSSLASMRLAPGAHGGLSLLKRHGFRIAIVSLTWEFAVEWFARQFEADYCVGARLSPDGQVVHIWHGDKPVWLRGLAAGLGTPMDRVAAVGDSAGDLDMLQAVGHPYWVGSDLPEGLTVSRYPDGNIERIAKDIVAAVGG